MITLYNNNILTKFLYLHIQTLLSFQNTCIIYNFDYKYVCTQYTLYLTNNIAARRRSTRSLDLFPLSSLHLGITY